MDDSRKRFERFVTSPPFEKSAERFGDDPSKFGFPGSYRDIKVDFAWQAWQESERQARKLQEQER